MPVPTQGLAQRRRPCLLEEPFPGTRPPAPSQGLRGRLGTVAGLPLHGLTMRGPGRWGMGWGPCTHWRRCQHIWLGPPVASQIPEPPPPPHRPGQPWPASPLRAWPWCLCAFLAPPTFLNRWEQPAQTYFLVFGIFHVVYLYIPISGRFLWHCLNANVHRLAVAPLTVDRVLFHGLVSPDGAHTCHVTDLLHRAAPLVAQGTCCSSPAPPTTPRRLPASLSPRTDGGHPFPRPYPHYPGALGPRTADQPVLEEGPTS